MATLEQEFKKFVEPFVDDIFKYSMHSMRSGAASNTACRCIPGDLLDMHAGWRCMSFLQKHIHYAYC